MQVTGPISGGVRGRPFGMPLFDLADHGYRADEYVMSGEATRFRPVGGATLGEDGRWDAEPAGTAPYRTRLLVYRPIDPAACNGTAVVSWNNVSAGYELFGGDTAELLEGGYVFVGASVQRVGIEGLPPTPMGLAAWDPDRYGSLSHPGDDFSFDIFTQAGRAARSLEGLDIQRVVAMGASQSAGRLGAYVNAIHPLAGAFDGFLLTIYFGTGTQLEVGDAVVNLNAPATATASLSALRGRNRLRDDLDVPVFVVNSELEAMACLNVRQPDTDRFRYWEAAGTSHVSAQVQGPRALKFQRDFGQELPVTERMNRVPMLPLYDSALHHLDAWVRGDGAPPVQPKIEFTDDGEVVRDEHGIAVGGIRLPLAEVPVATNSAIPLGPGIYPLLQGSSAPFSREKLLALYGDEAGYAARVEEAARACEKAGVVLPRDVEPMVAEAISEFRSNAAAG
jgi:hypothetical protein